jgi:hypothetical protein
MQRQCYSGSDTLSEPKYEIGERVTVSIFTPHIRNSLDLIYGQSETAIKFAYHVFVDEYHKKKVREDNVKA